MGSIVTLFKDIAKTNAIFPRTKVSAVSDGDDVGLDAILNGKQDKLVSGTNIKTVNGISLVGSGNVGIATPLIDTSNPITVNQSYTTSPKVYTATEDCFVTWTTNYNADTYVCVDGIGISPAKNHQNHRLTLYLKKDQALRMYQTDDTTEVNLSNIYAYGLLKGGE